MKSQIPLAKRDLQIIKLEKEIESRKQLLINKRKELEENNKINHHLEGVKQKYNKYYENTIKEKQQQYDAILLIKQYLDEIINSKQLSNEDLRTAKHEQNTIMKEIEKVKSELEDLLK